MSTSKGSKSSKQWLQRQKNDEFVKKAKALGYRSRAAFKLLEINQRDKLIKPGMNIVDLGAAPGGWSQIAKNLVGNKGKVLALDILPIDPLPGVDIIIGDFTEAAVYEELVKKLAGDRVDLVISDMAPNISGIRSADVPRAVYLGEIALEFAIEVLGPDGVFLVKMFQGEGFTEYLDSIKQAFKKVVIRKPKASRSESREVYILARDLKR